MLEQYFFYLLNATLYCKPAFISSNHDEIFYGVCVLFILYERFYCITQWHREFRSLIRYQWAATYPNCRLQNLKNEHYCAPGSRRERWQIRTRYVCILMCYNWATDIFTLTVSKIQIWNTNLNIGPEFELSSPVIEAAGWLHHLVPHRSLSLLRHKITFLSNPFSHETNHFLWQKEKCCLV